MLNFASTIFTTIMPAHYPSNTPLESILLATAYLPPIEYVWLLTKTAKAVIEVHETYPKQTWRNRCRIMTSNGAHNLVIPVIKPFGNHTKTRDVEVSGHLPWQKTHWQTIATAYAKAPYFIYYRDLLEPFYARPFSGKLVEWNLNLLYQLVSVLKIPAGIALSKQFARPSGEGGDFRNNISPKVSKATASGDILWPAYRQVFAEKECFIPNLSVIDLLFCMGPDATDYLRRCSGLAAYYSIAG